MRLSGFRSEDHAEKVYTDGSTLAGQLRTHARVRYQLAPPPAPIARFERAGSDPLEVGVGIGTITFAGPTVGRGALLAWI